MEKPGRSEKVGGRLEGSSDITWGIEPDPEEDEEGSAGMTWDMSLKMLVRHEIHCMSITRADGEAALLF